MKDCLNEIHAMNPSDTNAGGWNGCEIRTWLNNTVYNQLPDSIKQILKLMNVWTANGGNQAGTTGVYSEDYLALPAEREVFGSNTSADSTVEAQLIQLEWYKTAGNRIKKVNGGNSWWNERSPNCYSPYYVCGVTSSGSGNYDRANISRGVSFIGCI